MQITLSDTNKSDKIHHNNYGLSKFLVLFDSNKDGKVDQNEFKKAATKRFKNIDKNANKIISQEELSSYLNQRRKNRRLKLLSKIDSDDNNSISLDEYIKFKQEKAKRRFKYIDANNDGKIEKSELLNHRRWYQTGRFAKRLFNKLDLDNNGKISQNESIQAWSRWFKKLDRNKDELVTEKDGAN